MIRVVAVYTIADCDLPADLEVTMAPGTGADTATITAHVWRGDAPCATASSKYAAW